MEMESNARRDKDRARTPSGHPHRRCACSDAQRLRFERRCVRGSGDHDGRIGVGHSFGGRRGGKQRHGWTLSSSTKAGLGAYLVAESTTGGDPLAVYVFNKDTPGSGKSACDVTCSKIWRPLLLKVSDTVRVSGITGTFAQVTWSDGTVQVTYNGAPLYFSTNDHGAGDTNGVGLSDSWSVATP